MNNFGTIYRFELKKVLGQPLAFVSVLLGTVLLLGCALLSLSGTGYYYRYDAQENAVERTPMPYREVEAMRRDYLRPLSGQMLDDAQMAQLVAGYDCDETGTLQWNLNAYSPFLYLNTLADRPKGSAEDFYHTQVRTFDPNPDRYPLTGAERTYWQEQARTLEPFRLDYAGGWQAMAQSADLLCQVTVLLATVCLCRLFSQEHRTRTDQLVLSSAKGKFPAFLARWTAGATFAVGLSLLFSGLYVFFFCAFYGPDGFSTALQLWQEGLSCPLHLSIGQFVMVLLALLALASVMMAALVMLLSELLRTAVPALSVPFILSGVVLLELFQGKGRPAEQIAAYLPFCRISTDTLTDYCLVTLGRFQCNSIQFSFLLYPLLALLFAGLCWQRYISYQVTGR